MTQIKLGANHIGGRLFKSAATSALALSALAGGVMLSGSEVKAGNVVNYTDQGVDFTDTLTVIQAPTFTGGGLVPKEALANTPLYSQKRLNCSI